MSESLRGVVGPLGRAQLDRIIAHLRRLAEHVTVPTHGFKTTRRERDTGDIEYQITAEYAEDVRQIAFVSSTRHDAEFIAAVLAQAPLFRELFQEPGALPVRLEPQELHRDCHDLVCNGSREHPRGAVGVSCSCRGRDTAYAELNALKAGAVRLEAPKTHEDDPSRVAPSVPCVVGQDLPRRGQRGGVTTADLTESEPPLMDISAELHRILGRYGIASLSNRDGLSGLPSDLIAWAADACRQTQNKWKVNQ